MASFGNLFTTIGRLLPNYVEGREKAIESNWKDLSNYNTVQKGQLQNAFAEATFQPRVHDVFNNSALGDYTVADAARENEVKNWQMPFRRQMTSDQYAALLQNPSQYFGEGFERGGNMNPYAFNGQQYAPQNWAQGGPGSPLYDSIYNNYYRRGGQYYYDDGFNGGINPIIGGSYWQGR